MKHILTMGLTVFSLLAACVTINVYFPAAEAEEAADRIIEEVRGASDETAPLESGQTLLREGRHVPYHLASITERVLTLLTTPAHAQGKVDFSASSPAVRKLESSLKKRFASLRSYFQSGALGLTQEALVAIRDRNLIPLPERNKVRQLVAEQNGDWNALYREIAKANGNPAWERDIRNTFAKRNIAKLERGWHYQSADGTWKTK